jgi:hypothetical protein
MPASLRRDRPYWCVLEGEPINRHRSAAKVLAQFALMRMEFHASFQLNDALWTAVAKIPVALRRWSDCRPCWKASNFAAKFMRTGQSSERRGASLRRLRLHHVTYHPLAAARGASLLAGALSACGQLVGPPHCQRADNHRDSRAAFATPSQAQAAPRSRPKPLQLLA